jgi:RNA polymerase sigma factor (TIGR02999 family)
MAEGGESSDVTELLNAWGKGNPEALDQLLPLVYGELRALAGSYMRGEREGHLLQTTALVHEVYLRLVDQRRANLESRGHFFSVAARMMRRVLLDYAKAAGSAKRGGGVVVEPLDPDRVAISPNYLIDLERALGRLEEIDQRKCRVVELRYYAGLTTEECASVLDVSAPTIERDWALAKAWLYRELTGEAVLDEGGVVDHHRRDLHGGSGG